MKKVGILAATIVWALAVNVSLAGSRDALWSQVQDAINQGLPQTAIKLLDQIIPGALRGSGLGGGHQGHLPENRRERRDPG